MTKHTELIERLRKGVEAMDDCSDGVALIKCDALMSAGANALEAQAREIAGLQAARMAYASEFPPDGEGEPDVGSIHQNIRAMKAEIEGLRKDAERWRWATEQAEFFSMVVDGTGLHCAEVAEAESAVDAAIAMKGQP